MNSLSYKWYNSTIYMEHFPLSVGHSRVTLQQKITTFLAAGSYMIREDALAYLLFI